MKTLTIRPAEPEHDFGKIAAWFSSVEDEPTSESQLKEYYEKQKGRIIARVAEEDDAELLGFYWAVHDKVEPDRMTIDLFVDPKQRGQGVGRRLYEHLIGIVKEAGAKKLRVSIRDTDLESRAFAERRGFTEQRHQIGMALDLIAFDDKPYDWIIAKLKDEGFQFTSMDALGNTEENQRKLYTLNDTTAATTPGTNGEHSWASFEDFQERVCRSDWYHPGGQMVVIEPSTGAWVAMSAITRMKGCDYAYNLFTGVEMAYRGRKLGQAVKILALRHARDVLKVSKVHTNHNTKNLPMIAIDRKLGYVQTPGTFLMEKSLE